MPDLRTVGPDEIISVHRWDVTHTPTGLRCEGAPFETLTVMFHGARSVDIDIRKQSVDRKGIPTCVPGLIMLRDELSKIITEYLTLAGAASPLSTEDALRASVRDLERERGILKEQLDIRTRERDHYSDWQVRALEAMEGFKKFAKLAGLV